MNITDICIRKPVFAWMLMAATIVFGLVAATRIGISQFPDVDNPNITVSVSWEGASPEEVENSIVNPIEQTLAQVEGVQSMTSQSRQGSARITVVFDMDRDIDLALQDTQAKVSQATRSLPADVDPPTVSKSNPDDQPIIQLGLSGPFSRKLLSDVAQYQIVERLQTVPGVGQVQTNGSVARNIRIWINTDALIERGLTVTDVTAALTKEHVTVPGGQVDTGPRQISLKFLGEALDLDTFGKIIVKEINGGPVYLSDVAMVEDGFADTSSSARVDGAPLQAIGILKQRGTNAVSVAKDIRAAVDELKKTLPDGMELKVLYDTTGFIEESVQEIEMELGLALVLTSIVCWLFLGSLSATLNVILAIPMSLLGTVAVIYFLHFTLNTFTLLGLSLAVGLVVDDAVMVMENIFRHADMGKDRIKAASEGTKEITFAALAATLAVIAIFLPVVFMSGVVGRYFFQFGITLSIAVALSYLEAISLAPARCAQILSGSHAKRNWLGRTVDNLFGKLERSYSWALERALRFPLTVLAIAVAIMASAVYVALHLPGEFVPSQDQSRFAVRLTTAVGSSLAETDKLVKEAEVLVSKHPEVSSNMITTSAGGGSMTISLVDPGQRKQTQLEFMATIRKELSAIPGLKVAVQDLSQQGFTGSTGKPIEFSVRGADYDLLVKTATDMKNKLNESGLGVDVDTDYQIGLPEFDIQPDRGRISDLGVTVQDVATTINALVGGQTIGKYSSEGRRIDVRLRLVSSQRSRPEDIGLLRVRTPDGDMIPLQSLVKIDENAVLQSISHADRERAITVTGNIGTGHSQTEALAYVQELAKGAPLGTRVVLGGQSSSFNDSMSSLFFALILGILVAYMVLASQFNSFLHPVTVLSILPLSIAGAAYALLIAHKTLNVFSMIGVLLLMGIVKKNSIILVDYAAMIQKEEGLDARASLMKAGPIRLRPILMTSIATLMSAVPSAMGLGPGAETRAPMADAVIGGLLLSTVLSLLVVPAFYLVADRIKGKIFKKKPEPIAHAPEPHAAE